jgi:uncharacterized protein YndB with AHSA1/START domain
MTDAPDGIVAEATTTIAAPATDVWRALTDPDDVRQWMFGTTLATDWREGSPITWSGEWEGTAYEDKGMVLRVDEGRCLQFTHFSPLTGQPDVPENYHTVTIDLAGDDPTEVHLTQDGNDDEQARDHAADNWRMMLDGLRRHTEGRG